MQITVIVILTIVASHVVVSYFCWAGAYASYCDLCKRFGDNVLVPKPRLRDYLMMRSTH